MDTIKDKLGMARSKAGDYAQQHGDKVESGIDKAAQTADSKTGGKYSDKIKTGTQKAKDAARNLGDKGGGGQT
ncbi:antitoxin [Actinacidiphila epipremni]|nr:antitoxin [Actinacidiphila epipremni]